jgi:GrpB-like predicted nucleotidyltransferase (UPF0157 family)
MRLGIPRQGTVRLAAYSPTWAEEFLLERSRIVSALGDRLLGIEHVGSTAIPGICAKPIIDVACGVVSLEAVDALVAPMAGIGYDFPGDVGIVGERIFGRGAEIRTHLVHVVRYGGTEWRNYLSFRDALRADPELAHQYDELKSSLAAKYPEDRASYNVGKMAFIEGVLAGAA